MSVGDRYRVTGNSSPDLDHGFATGTIVVEVPYPLDSDAETRPDAAPVTKWVADGHGLVQHVTPADLEPLPAEETPS